MRTFHTEKTCIKVRPALQSMAKPTTGDRMFWHNLFRKSGYSHPMSGCRSYWSELLRIFYTNLSDSSSNIWPIAVPRSTEDKDKDIPLTGPKDAAFRHYCSCYPGGKPTYNIKLKTHCCKEVAFEVLRGFASIGIAYGSLTRGPTFDISYFSMIRYFPDF